MTEKQTTLTVNFNAGDSTEERDDDGKIIPDLSIELDEERHAEIYSDASKSTFEVGERCYFRILFSGDYSAIYEVSTGSVKSEVGSGIKTITESIVFRNEKTGSLSYKPDTSVTYNWLGKKTPPATPRFNGKEITLNNETLGVLVCAYGVSYKKVSINVGSGDLRGQSSIPVVLAVKLYEGSGAGALGQEGDGGGLVNQDFGEVTYYAEIPSVSSTIQVLDYSTGNPVAGAAVSINGISKGSTNASGKMDVDLKPGVEHSIRIEADDYVTNTEDVLNNDTFIIPIA